MLEPVIPAVGSPDGCPALGPTAMKVVQIHQELPSPVLRMRACTGAAPYPVSGAASAQPGGGSVFWERIDGPMVNVAAGTLDIPTGLTTVGHIYAAEASDYYAVTGLDGGMLGSDAAQGAGWPGFKGIIPAVESSDGRSAPHTTAVWADSICQELARPVSSVCL
jgi:hypothetical protein